MIWLVIELAAIFVECFMASRLLIKYFGFHSDKNIIFKWITLFLCLSVSNAIGSFIIENEMFLIISFLLIEIIFSISFLKGNLFEKIAISAVSYILFYFVNLPVLTLSSVITDFSASIISDTSSQSVVRILGIFITKLLYFVVTQLILIFRKKEKYQFKLDEWVIVISAFSITLIIGFCIYTMIIGNFFQIYIYVMIAVLLSLMDVIIFVFTRKMNLTNQKEIEKQKLQSQLIHQQNEIQQLEKQYKEISILRHDHKNQLNCLKMLIKERKLDDAERYLQEFIGNQNYIIKPHIHSSSSVLNAVINEKFSKAEQKKIDPSCRILVPIPKYLEYDLSIMLSNLLDNAIEACVKNFISSQIILLITDVAGYYRVVVKNTIQKSVLEKNKNLETNKDDQEQHGWGLKSVQDITNKYMGTLDIYEKNGMFVVSALLIKNEIRNMGTEKVTLGAK